MSSTRSSESFGPLARIIQAGSSSRIVTLPTSTFERSFKAQVTDSRGGKLADVEYKMLRPNGEKAYFHLLLDASSSTSTRVSTGDRKRVYEYLLQNFEHLVEGSDSPLLPNDVIYVWAFSWRTTLLCRVEKKEYHAQREATRAAYKTEVQGNKHMGTRLYDTIATAMDRIREKFKMYPDADFFLVPFTDGVDHGSEKSLQNIMESINYITARLHTIFITANISRNCELYKRLESQEKEISHIRIESTEPADISKAFNTLRHLMIKAFLVVSHSQGGVIRSAGVYGATPQDVAKQVSADVRSAQRNLKDRHHETRRIQGPK